MTWKDWGTHHAVVFGMTFPRELEQIQAWGQILARDGYTPAEATEATDWMAAHSPPERRGQMLPRLVGHLRSARERRAAAPQSNPEDCRLCGSPASGRVPVPDYDAIARTHSWYWTTVTCRCALGRWKAGQRVELVTLEQYEGAHPSLWEDVRRHFEALREYSEAAREATDLDAVLGRILRRLRQ